MTTKSEPKSTKAKQIAKIVISGLMIGLLVLTLTAVGLTFKLKNTIKQQRFKSASRQAALALPVAQTWNTLTLHQIPLLKIWVESLKLTKQLPQLKTSLPAADKVLALERQELISADLEKNLIQSAAHLKTINQNLTSCLVCQLLNSKHQTYQPVLQAAQQTLTWLPELKTGQHQFVFWLQNSDEIRATGGFVGAVLLVEIKQNQLQEPVFLDIYDLAGQTKTTASQTPGLSEFLAGAQGIKITDANWHPDFDQAVNDWLEFIPEESSHLPLKKNNIRLVGAINLEFVERLLALVGPIKLADYKQTITNQNFSQVARQNRGQFFAGDIQKKQFLSQVFNQLKIKLTTADQAQLSAIIQLTLSALNHYQLQLKAVDPELQTALSPVRLAQQLDPNPELRQGDYFLYLVESNVGINKANRLVDRQVKLEIEPQLIRIQVNYQNNNSPLSTQELTQLEQNPDLLQAKHNQYINYLRLITNSNLELIKANCSHQPERKPDAGLILDSHNRQWLQIGLLSATAENSDSSCNFTLKSDYQITPENRFVIGKQPGIKPVLWTVSHLKKTTEFTLETTKQL
ncbi:MAG: DUF4012 domain-containing protein [Candidatus Pacebacteria bacterium]|nr:DUF4012 domain-containing protein [Candidatus Paceibacterota bacterium]